MKSRTYLPGSTIGVMGGGQLGRMFAIAARRMGYRIHTFAPMRTRRPASSPTGKSRRTTTTRWRSGNLPRALMC